MPHPPPPDVLFVQLIPLFLVSVIHAVIVFLIASKRRVARWGWTVPTLIPLVGMLVALTFYVATALSILDRLDALEGRRS